MKFACQESRGGQCCKTGWQGREFIFLTDKDAEKIEDRTGLKREDFSQVARFDWTRFSKTPVRARYMTDCEFFNNGKCEIYDSRPIQCRTFPHWPEVVPEEMAPHCPGIGMGEETGSDLLREQVAADLEYAVI